MSPGGQDRPPKQRTISFTPALPDGTDCPWIRDRRTRWWLVIPADFMAVALVALFSAASTHTMGQDVTALPGSSDVATPIIWRWRYPRGSSSWDSSG